LCFQSGVVVAFDFLSADAWGSKASAYPPEQKITVDNTKPSTLKPPPLHILRLPSSCTSSTVAPRSEPLLLPHTQKAVHHAWRVWRCGFFGFGCAHGVQLRGVLRCGGSHASGMQVNTTGSRTCARRQGALGARQAQASEPPRATGVGPQSLRNFNPLFPPVFLILSEIRRLPRFFSQNLRSDKVSCPISEILGFFSGFRPERGRGGEEKKGKRKRKKKIYFRFRKKSTKKSEEKIMMSA